MVDSSGGAVFPVVFFDGEREVDIGNVLVQPTLDFKNFQTILSQKIGISPNQISIYLFDRAKLWPEDRRKMPITGKANFSLIARERDCFFYVVLKRSRRGRRRKSSDSVEFGDFLPENKLSASSENFSPMPEKLFLLRRNQSQLNSPQISGYVSPYYNQISSSELMNLNNQLQNLQIQRENQAMINSNFSPNLSLNFNSRLNSSQNVNLDLNSFPRIEDSYWDLNNRGLCLECTDSKKNGRVASFHHCAYDVVVKNFRTKAGPIARPSKASRY
ncbi:unnamed protein product [Ilex paraguariensis]|uniref:DUF7138 domain-containing protein n=1 Tax=Ilex paraguariensis TaxID=185542 RepID=A0ABC8SAX3_9AQUA